MPASEPLVPELDRYLGHLAARGAAPASSRAARADLRGLVRWWQEHRRQPFAVALLRDRDLRAWLKHRQREDGAAPSTINRGLCTVRVFCVWAVAEGLLPENPAAGLAEVPAVEPVPRSVPDEVVDALLRAAGGDQNAFLRARDQAALALLAYAGLRVQELCDVQLRDLDLPGGTVTVRSGKGGKARRVPLHAEAARLLQTYMDKVRCPAGLPAVGADEEREALLLGQEVCAPGQPLRPGVSPSLVRQRIRLAGRRAAEHLRQVASRESSDVTREQLGRYAELLERVSPHQLRHSLARRMLRRGAQLSEVQRLLGHTRLSTTGVYLTPSEDDLREAVDRAGV